MEEESGQSNMMRIRNTMVEINMKMKKTKKESEGGEESEEEKAKKQKNGKGRRRGGRTRRPVKELQKRKTR